MTGLPENESELFKIFEPSEFETHMTIHQKPKSFSTSKDWQKYIEKYERRISQASKTGQDIYDSISYEEIKSCFEVEFKMLAHIEDPLAGRKTVIQRST